MRTVSELSCLGDVYVLFAWVCVDILEVRVAAQLGVHTVMIF